jgi:Methyltransferase domain
MKRSLARLMTVAQAIVDQPKHFFRTCETEAGNLHWLKRAQALDNIPEVSLTELVHASTISLNTVTFRAGGSSVPDYLLLAGLCESYPHCHYFEIGTFLGESLANVAPFCEHCLSLSLSDEQFAASAEMARQARQVSRIFSQPLPNVEHLYGNSMHYDFGRISDRFDVIFVDGCHDYSAVVSDTSNVIRLLRNDQSVVVFHDAKNAYNEIEPEVVVGIYDGLPVHWRKSLYTVANTLCAVVTKRPVKPFKRISLKENLYSKPTVKFGLEVRIDNIA